MYTRPALSAARFRWSSDSLSVISSTVDHVVSGAPSTWNEKRYEFSIWSDQRTPIRFPKRISEQMSSVSRLLVFLGRVTGELHSVSEPSLWQIRMRRLWV